MKDPHARVVSQARAQGSLVNSVVEFCSLLKSHGLQISRSNTDIALAGLAEIDIVSFAHFRMSLRICLLQRPEDIPAYNDLFDSYWRNDSDSSPHDTQTEPPQKPEFSTKNNGESNDTELSVSAETLSTDNEQENDSEANSSNQSPHAIRALARDPLAENDPSNNTAALDRIGRSFARALARRRSRRHQSHRSGKRIDSRKLMRSAVRHGGIPLELPWRRQQIRRSRLVIFCDVSRSMDSYAELLLQFAAAVLRHAWRVEVFLFANDLVRVSDRWHDENWTSLTENFTGLGGGTQIGASLQSFVDNYHYCLNSRQCVAIVLSDGLDAGEPASLKATLRRIKAGSRQLIWLNPLLATPAYEPIARGMAAALPLVDVFASGHNLESLQRIASVLHEAPSRIHDV